MITTKSGVTIEFDMLDEWVVKMTVSVPHTRGHKVVASPKIAISQLKEEITKLEQPIRK